ncbi:MAG: amino acid permease, partial [Gammaproteobacteria bacterium]|nr:amino acid permease [Gammaproteobacteria bacterium]
DPRLLNVNSNVALSPFTIIFSMAGIPYITGVMNFVILMALLSACNSDLYSATRILWNLSVRGSAPKLFSKINRAGIPISALLMTASFGLLAFLCNFFGGATIFLMLVNISSLAGFIAWFGIARSHIGFRKHYLAQGKKLKDLPFQSHFYPAGPVIAMVLSVIVIFGQWYVLMAQNQMSWSAFIATYAGLPVVFMLWLGNKWYHRKK